jgi:hypothetical protein
MYSGSDHMQSNIHPNTIRDPLEIHKLKSRTIWVISAVLTVAFLLIPLMWVDNTQTHSLNYTFPCTTASILKAYVRFTGTQFLIINKNQFNWTDVRIEINTDSSQNHYLHETTDPNAFMLMLPKMDIGEAYPIKVTQFRRDDGTKLDPVTTRPENIKIWSDTPHGRGFWYGRVTDAMAVLHYQTLPCDLGDLVHHRNPRPDALQGSQ